MSGHPAPRFEILHQPLRPDQPWSVRFIGANGEQVWRTSESYSDVRDAEHAISLLAEALGSQALFEGVKAQRDAPRPAPVPVLRVEVEP